VNKHPLMRTGAITALATGMLAGTASAQSVLERVLGEIDNATNLAPANGIFANIAENLGGTRITEVERPVTFGDLRANGFAGYDPSLILIGDPDVMDSGWDYVGQPHTLQDLIDDPELDVMFEYTAIVDGSISDDAILSSITIEVEGEMQTVYFLTDPDNGINFDSPAAGYVSRFLTDGDNSDLFSEADIESLQAEQVIELLKTAGYFGIDGSITNILDGIMVPPTATDADGVTAIEWDMPTIEFGDMATTALGAVNTGDITLGVNSTVDEAKTSSTQAVSSVMEQLGGADGNGALVLNIASNMTGVNGSISNTMTEVNAKTANLSTTALGAVNTGTITSGVNAAVQGIVGTSGSTAE
jgi:hypothetical protein